MQFLNAEILEDGIWELSNLLRAQLGSETPMNSGASIGNYAVLLDEQLETITLDDHERHLALQWRVGPATDIIASKSYAQQTVTFTDLAAKPFSPVHLAAQKQLTGDVTFNWVRRTRLFGDDWEVTDVPLGEPEEHYKIRIFSGATVIRELAAEFGSINYAAADQISDFGTMPNQFDVGVSQLNSTGDRGTERRETLNTN